MDYKKTVPLICRFYRPCQICRLCRPCLCFAVFLLPVLIMAGGCRREDNFSVSPQARPVRVQIEGPGAFPREIRDSAGRTLRLEAPPERIVSLGPNITETIFALGKGGLLAGRTEQCDYPPQAAAVVSVGEVMDPSLETILALSPDLAAGSAHVSLAALARLEELGIPGLIFAGQTFEGVYDVIAGVGALTGADDAAAALIRDMEDRAERVKSRYAGRSEAQRPRVYYVVGFGESGEWTAGGDTFIHRMIELAGGRNTAGALRGWSYSLEKLLEDDPDIILLNQGLGREFSETSPYSRLRAVREGRVYEVPEDLIVRLGPRLILGLELMADIFYPGTGSSAGAAGVTETAGAVGAAGTAGAGAAGTAGAGAGK